MHKACWIWLVAVTLGSAGLARAEDKPALPDGAMTLDDLRKQATKQQSGKTTAPVPKPTSSSRSGIGAFFRNLFGPSQPKPNGMVIRGAQTYTNGISPLPPIAPR